MTYTKRLTQGKCNRQGWPCCSLLAAVFGLPVSPLAALAQERPLLAQVGGNAFCQSTFWIFLRIEARMERCFQTQSASFFASIDCFDMFKSYSISNWQVRLLHIGFVSRKGVKSELSMGSLWLCTVPGSFQRAFSLSLKRWANIKSSKRSRSMVV